jgi:hypothetical protein
MAQVETRRAGSPTSPRHTPDIPNKVRRVARWLAVTPHALHSRSRSSAVTHSTSTNRHAMASAASGVMHSRESMASNRARGEVQPPGRGVVYNNKHTEQDTPRESR